MDVDKSDVACATPAEIADENTEEPCTLALDAAEVALAAAEARAEEAPPMAEVNLASTPEVAEAMTAPPTLTRDSPAERTPLMADSISFWAEVRARRVARKASLENCILAWFVFVWGLEWRSGVGVCLFFLLVGMQVSFGFSVKIGLVKVVYFVG